MNAHSRKLIKAGDVFEHLESGAIYKLVSIKEEMVRRKMSMQPQPTGVMVYKFLDVKTNQEMEYTWAMFRDRLKFADVKAQILYNDQNSDIKTGRENVE